jgi:hypothetical protein
MSTIIEGSADPIQRIAEAAMLAAARSAPWFWGEPSAEEAEFVLGTAEIERSFSESEMLDEAERAAVLVALVPLIAAEHENQLAVIESYALDTAEQLSADELRDILRDGDLPPPERYSYELALCIHEHAQDYTVSELETLATLDSNTAVETMAYKDAASLRRKIYAQRRGKASKSATID